ncbi:MAG TPA: sulfatase-like hydrolase/transferase, partial [Actinomycetota bacterium]
MESSSEHVRLAPETDRSRKSTRRSGVAIALLVCSLIGIGLQPRAQAGGTAPSDVTARGGSAPNIVVIVSDDQRWDTIRDMPEVMASIADRGVLYPNAMVPTSLCCPSRASLLLGRYAHSTGVWSNQGKHGGWRRFFANGHESSNLATWLDDAGY